MSFNKTETMKIFLLIISLTFVSVTSFGQWSLDNYDLNFDDTIGIQHVTIDTTSNPDNIWQIGTPQKSIFTSSFSSPNAIITDTINSYPSNDTSVFIITNVASGGGFEWAHTVILSGQYFVNSDTLTDFGTIEFSPDNGSTWIDLVNDTIYGSSILWYFPKPTLTGNSNGWQHFYVNIAQLGPIFNIHDGDTILYRFTFISDGVQTNKDGLMFDDFHFEDWAEGVEETPNDNSIAIYPNPVRNQLSINIAQNGCSHSIQIVNSQGQVVYSNKQFRDNFIDIGYLPDGMYFLLYSDAKDLSSKKLIVNHGIKL